MNCVKLISKGFLIILDFEARVTVVTRTRKSAMESDPFAEDVPEEINLIVRILLGKETLTNIYH